MRILLANYRYFLSGGPERYMFGAKRLMEEAGHVVDPFSVRSGHNEPTPHEPHFLSPIGRTDAHLYEDYDRSPATMAKVLGRCYYSLEGFIKARRFAARVRPDVAYCLQFLNKMSPSVLDGFKSAGVPVVMRASDFGLVCPQGHLLAGDEPCRRCVGRVPWPAVWRQCVKGSLAASLVKASAWALHRWLGCIRRIDALVCPSAFLRDIFLQAGMRPDRLHHVPTFIDAAGMSPDGPHDGGFVFSGRATPIKGVELLLRAHALLGDQAPPLTITGCADDGYCRELASRYAGAVRFEPFLGRDELFAVVGRALAIITPSLWYENMPNAALEAMALGRAVIAPDHGAFPEIVRHGETGLLFKPNDAEALRARLEWAAGHPEEMARMGMAARAMVLAEHSPHAHLAALEKIFESVAGKRASGKERD